MWWPLVWSKSSTKIAFPIWIENRMQKLAVIDIIKLTITIFSEKYHVLQIETFDGNNIVGIDSPIYQTKTLNLDITLNGIESIKKII